MYIETPDEAKKFLVEFKRKIKNITGVDIEIAPTFTLLPTVYMALKNSVFKVIAQTLSGSADPKRTGDVSATMLKSVGVSSVIIGHSERRATGETNDIIKSQVLRATEAGLGILLCVGEIERDQSGEYFSFIETQLLSALKNFPIKSVSKLVIAYEPVWAIGKTATDAMPAEDVQEMIIFIRKTLVCVFDRTIVLKIPVLYGGSVEAENAMHLVEVGGVSGFLVGHASTEVSSFVKLLQVLV